MWKLILNEKDYKVWRKGTQKVAVYRNWFNVPSGRRYKMSSYLAAFKRAKTYMSKN